MNPIHNQHDTHHEEPDQSGRHARHHRRTWGRQHLCCRFFLQKLPGLRQELLLLPEVLGRQLLQLLQVIRWTRDGGLASKKPAPIAAFAAR